uniref:Uncharacterized protein n=1 Tax=Bionectria ochroleuca TaxID=29856 RepID=A0A8H7NCN3_BIOOC
MNTKSSDPAATPLRSGQVLMFYYFRSLNDPLPELIQSNVMSESDNDQSGDLCSESDSEDSCTSKDLCSGPPSPSLSEITREDDPVNLTEEDNKNPASLPREPAKPILSSPVNKSKMSKRKRCFTENSDNEDEMPHIRDECLHLKKPYIGSDRRVRFSVPLEDALDVQFFRLIVIETLGEDVWENELAQMGLLDE